MTVMKKYNENISEITINNEFHLQLEMNTSKMHIFNFHLVSIPLIMPSTCSSGTILQSKVFLSPSTLILSTTNSMFLPPLSTTSRSALHANLRHSSSERYSVSQCFSRNSMTLFLGLPRATAFHSVQEPLGSV